MDTRLLDLLRNAPSLDLYQLSLTIHQLLGDPERILAIRARLHLGARVQFYHHQRHELVTGTVIELRQTEVTVREDATHEQWRLPYAAVVPDAAAPAAPPPQAAPIKPVSLKVGDKAGFTDKHLRERVGTVVRVNDRTVSLDCNGERWRVSPQFLRKIIDV